MNISPVIFQDNEAVYKSFATKYVPHVKGLFILAPSGSGKTYYCEHQTEKHWIDGDDLWLASGAHPDGPWWKESLEVINRIDQRSDVVTVEAKTQGLWIMGASNYWLKPDAIVIPEWEMHKAYIAKREQTNYDGGATSEDYSQVQSHMEFIRKWNTNHGVPLYTSIEEAVEKLMS